MQLDTELTLLELQQVELDWSQMLYERDMESLHMVDINRARLKAQANRVKERELNLAELESGDVAISPRKNYLLHSPADWKEAAPLPIRNRTLCEIQPHCW